MGFPISEVGSKGKGAIYGMIFSIMEARYRDRNINGKTNLKLKVAEGDLWPFLVYCKNISVKKEEGKIVYKYEWADIDKIVDGVYQWMYYYENKFEKTGKGNTITSMTVEEGEEEEEEIDWEAEYLELTNEEEFPYLSGEKLQDFYNRVSKVRNTFKKSKENSEGIFGAEEMYDITSEVSFSEAMSEMKKAMEEMCKGTELTEVWSGLRAENISRTYMFAKNIMENEKIQEEYAYYNIGTNVINATPGLDGNEYILVDFERVRLEQPLMIKDETGTKTIKTYADTDKDGLYDRDELGKDGETYEYYDITKFIEKMVLSELYGSKYKVVERIPEEKKEGITYLTKEKVKETMTRFKKNLIRRRKEDSEGENRDSIISSANTVDPKEQAEYYLNCFESSDTEGSKYAKEEDVDTAKIKVQLYAFESNPIFKDTDFDGVPDGKGEAFRNAIKNNYSQLIVPKDMIKLDEKPQDNVQAIEIKNSETKVENANTHMDYRYFFMNNKNYYDELSTMSIMVCSVLNEAIRTGDKTKLNKLFTNIGMIKWYNLEDVEIKDIKNKINYVVGINDIEYTHNSGEKTLQKKVKLIAINPINVGEDNIEKIGEETTGGEHEAFNNLANEILNKEYVGNDYVYWVAGYGTGGAVANILSAKLIDKGVTIVPNEKNKISTSSYIMYDNTRSNKTTYGKLVSNVYAYTFGAPYTVYLKGSSKIEPYQSKYCSIFNVINGDDILSFLPSGDIGYGRFGISCYINTNGEEKTTVDAIDYIKDKDNSRGYTYKIDSSKRIELEKLFNLIFAENMKNAREYYNTKIVDKTLYEVFKEIREEYMLKGKADEILKKLTDQTYLNNNATIRARLINFITILNDSKHNIDYGKDIGAYYYLSKMILPEHLIMIINNEVVEKENLGEYITALEEMSEWYVNNVATYQSTLETETKSSLSSYKTKLNYIKQYKLKDRNQNIATYSVATNDSEGATNISTYSEAGSILKATEAAVKNYDKEYSKLKRMGNLTYYPCENLNTGDDTYKTAGDDCVRFAFSCFKNFNRNFIKDLKKYSGIDWGDINSKRLAGKEKKKKEYNGALAYAMSQLGFEIYDMDGCEPQDYNSDGEDDYEIKTLDSDFRLQKGDFVVCDGHVHFVLSDDLQDQSNNRKDNFGWGSVYREYPKNYTFKVEKTKEGKYQIKGGGKEYNRVYRYIGG